MNIKVGSRIHNRFDIEVRDRKTGELKQKGQAENIILDRIYTRLCNFSSYFTYIHFGQGEGSLDPSRTILFDELGYKSAETEQTVKDFPISKWTKKITLNPEEYVGKSITEVGISDTYSTTKSSSYINTHAIIKDAEGNQLSIEKTDTDVVIIYATVFIELQNKSESITFDESIDNPLITYLTGGSAPSNTLSVGSYSGDTPYYTGMEMGTKALTRAANINERKIIYTTRLGIDEFNNIDIAELGLLKVFRCNLVKSNIWNGYSFQQRNIGFGDGEKTVFIIADNKLTDVRIFENGILTSNYTLDNVQTEYPHESMENVVVANEINGDILAAPFNNSTYSGIYNEIFKVDPLKLNGRTLIVGGRDNTGNQTTWRFYVRASYDNINYTTIFQKTNYANGTYEIVIDQPWEYLNFEWSGSTMIYGIKLKTNERSSITFNTPPPEGAIITADYTVPYIPKSEDYVLDVTCEIQFGEGV